MPRRAAGLAAVRCRAAFTRMDPISRSILEAFDESGSQELDLSGLIERVARTLGQPAGALREQVLASVRHLLEQRWLRAAGQPELFARTEDGRLALAGPRDVTLYTRPGCHLCEEAKAQMAPLLREFGAHLREVNVDADPALRQRYTNEVPVIFLGARKVAKHRLDLAQFRRQLEHAR